MEYELLDTGVFDQDRYFDVFVEYAKASPEDLLIRITAHNRGPEAATLHLLPALLVPQYLDLAGRRAAPVHEGDRQTPDASIVEALHTDLGQRFL